jgi:hypothetical protein
MTDPTKTSEPPRIRLVFQLERAELPRLYDELARFHKGVKRVGRLRTLAYEGLLVQQGVLKLPGQASSDVSGTIGFDGDSDAAEVTNGLFEPAIDGRDGPSGAGRGSARVGR